MLDIFNSKNKDAKLVSETYSKLCQTSLMKLFPKIRKSHDQHGPTKKNVMTNWIKKIKKIIFLILVLRNLYIVLYSKMEHSNHIYQHKFITL